MTPPLKLQTSREEERTPDLKTLAVVRRLFRHALQVAAGNAQVVQFTLAQSVEFFMGAEVGLADLALPLQVLHRCAHPRDQRVFKALDAVNKSHRSTRMLGSVFALR
jgi:hypothetical protein